MQVGLKERLIGAAVLVVIAAIVIPWALKGNSTPGGGTVSQPLALPSASTAASVQTYRLPLNSSASGATEASGLAAGGSVEAPSPAMPTGAAPGSQAQPSSPAAPADNLASKPQPQPAAAAPAPAPTPPPVQPRSASRSAAGKWVVQAGSYDSERSALVVEHKLTTHGYHAFVSHYRSKGRTYYRVRVGPFSSRTEATQTRAGVARAAGTKAVVMPNS